ncbi:unnamed protein product [Pieris brassicae]|uniref:Uncharacterized protein n=1 Tax=Pieris brassicae TaxID=7116 RepID=A0A9P0X6Q9_PIEBR|nr:unnamed protein product [Pieris brassicae]
MFTSSKYLTANNLHKLYYASNKIKQFPIDGGRAKRSPQNDDESQLKDETRIYVYPCRTFRTAAAPRAAVSLTDPTPEPEPRRLTLDIKRDLHGNGCIRNDRD